MRNSKGQFTSDLRPEKKTGKILSCELCRKQKYIPINRLNTFRFCSNKCSNHKGYQKNTGRTHFKKGKIIFTGTPNEYKSLHYQIRKELGNPLFCEKCGSNQKIQWANRSQQYKKDLLDWIALCMKCHFNYDKQYLRLSI